MKLAWASEFKEGLDFTRRLCLKKTRKRAREMAQQTKALAAKFDDLGLIPRTHMVAGEN